MLRRDFSLSLVFSAGFDPAGSDVRAGFCRTSVEFEETRSLDLAVAAGAASSLAADAAVGAVAELGSRIGRVGDFGRGFVNDGGDVGPVFFTEFDGGFDAAIGALDTTDGRLGLSKFVFPFALGCSFFGSFEAVDFGDIFLGIGGLVGVASLLGVLGEGSADV